MQYRRFFSVHAWVVLVLALSSSAAHGALTFTNQFEANFRFTVAPGSPLASPGLPVGSVLDFQAFGPLTFTLDDSILNATTMNFLNATGTLVVANPPPFFGATLGPYSFVGGQLTNIVRDGNGDITSGFVSNLRMLWEMNAPGLQLYTRDSLPFNGNISSVPFGLSNLLAGPDPFDVYLQAGASRSLSDPLAVIGSDRTLTVTAVPEPSSLALLSLAGIGAVVYGVRRKKISARCEPVAL